MCMRYDNIGMYDGYIAVTIPYIAVRMMRMMYCRRLALYKSYMDLCINCRTDVPWVVGNIIRIEICRLHNNGREGGGGRGIRPPS